MLWYVLVYDVIAFLYCMVCFGQAAVVVKTDDDIYVDLYALHTVMPRYVKDKVIMFSYILPFPSVSLKLIVILLLFPAIPGGQVHAGSGEQVHRTSSTSSVPSTHPGTGSTSSAPSTTSSTSGELECRSRMKVLLPPRLVSYDELPRDEAKFPGNTTEYYPDYIGMGYRRRHRSQGDDLAQPYGTCSPSRLVPGGQPGHLGQDSGGRPAPQLPTCGGQNDISP